MLLAWSGSLVLLLILSACSMGDKVKAADAAVSKFHTEFNAKQFDVIFGNASPDYRSAITMDQNRKLFGGIQSKLGEAGASSESGWYVNYTTSGPVVRLKCKTKFAHGDAIETFVWKVDGNDAILVGYNINSLALVSQ